MSSVSSQHPAVVLRSQYTHMRALLAIAMVAVVGLSVAVVILATSGGQTRTVSAAPVSAPPLPAVSALPAGERYDGGPDEGTRGANATPLPSPIRYDGGPDEGTVGPGH